MCNASWDTVSHTDIPLSLFLKQLHIRIHISPIKNTENMTRNQYRRWSPHAYIQTWRYLPHRCHLLWCISVIRQNFVWHTDAASIGSWTDTAEEICSYDQCLHSIISAFGHFFARNHMMCCLSFDLSYWGSIDGWWSFTSGESICAFATDVSFTAVYIWHQGRRPTANTWLGGTGHVWWPIVRHSCRPSELIKKKVAWMALKGIVHPKM